MKSRAIEVLLVEDNHGDITLVKEALRETGASMNLHVIMDGVEAIRFLESGRTRPDFIILDLNIPGVNGYDILKHLKSDPELQEVPVVIFSTSNASKDIRKAYKMAANSYVKKPADLDEFFAVIGAMERFWMQTAELPGRGL